MSLRNLKKSSDKSKIKYSEQYDYRHNTGLRALSRVSLLIKKNVSQSKINTNTCLQAIAISATLHKTVGVCTLYISPHDPINEKTLKRAKQLYKTTS